MVNVFKEKDTTSKYVFLGIRIIVYSLALTIALSLLFGHRFLKIISESMEPKYYRGDVVMVDTKFDYDKLEIGDVITFKAGSSNVTHRVVDITEQGRVVTQGDANASVDTSCLNSQGKVVGLNEKNYVGKVVLGVKGLGSLLDFVAQKANFLILAVALILILFVTIM